MKLDYSVQAQVLMDMVDCVKSMVKGFLKEHLQGKVASPWNENLFKVNEKSPKLDTAQAELFHTVTAQGPFACNGARPDISPAIAYLTTQVRAPNQADWDKLVRIMKFLKQTAKDRLTLRANGSGELRWYVDASFAVHPDHRSHTGAVMTMGNGAITSISRKQGMNTNSSTEAEVVAANEVVGPMLWTKLFLKAQGYPISRNVLFQDNRSAMLLEENGCKRAGKRSRHLNIRFFFAPIRRPRETSTLNTAPLLR